MKFLCLSYLDEKKFDLMSESERETFVKECFAYDNSPPKERSLPSPGGVAKCAERKNPAPPKRKGVHDRWPVR